MIERDPYITIEEAERLGAGSLRTLFRWMDDRKLAWKAADEQSGNGRAARLVRVADLPSAARTAYWQRTLMPEGAAPPTADLATYSDYIREEVCRRLLIVLEALERLQETRGDKASRMLALAKQYGVGRSTLYGWIDAYRERGPEGLIPQWGKTDGRFFALPIELQECVINTLKESPRIPRVDLQRILKPLCKDLRKPVPSVATITRYIAAIPYAVKMEWEGPRTYAAKAAPKIHRDYLDLDVGEMWVGDHRLLDVFVRLSEDPKAKICRPWLTAWMDLRSRTIVGWHLDTVPSSHTIAQAFRSGCLRFGIPRRLYMDNGKDYTAHYWGGKALRPERAAFDHDGRGVLTQLHIRVTHALPYHPWSKAIESWFGHCLPSWECRLPGWCGSDNKQKPEKLPAQIGSGRIHTMDQIRALIAERIEDYHDRPHSGEGMNGATPRSLWVGVTKQIPDERALDVCLMHHKKVTVYDDGIRLFGFHYNHPELFHLQKMEGVAVRYDSGDISKLVVLHHGRHVCVAERQGAYSSDMTAQEAAAAKRMQRDARRRNRLYDQDRKILHDPDESMRQVVAQRPHAPSKVYTLHRTPRPEPGGRVITRITGLEQVADALEKDQAKSLARPAAPPPRRTAETPDELHELLRPPAAAHARPDQDAEREALLREII